MISRRWWGLKKKKVAGSGVLLLDSSLLRLVESHQAPDLHENLTPVNPTDHMELREGSNEDEDFEECVEELITHSYITLLTMPSLVKNQTLLCGDDSSGQ